MPETHRIEYKRELTPKVDLEKEVIAFLNAHEGGIIFIGIDKNNQVIGVSDVDGDMLKIKDRLKSNIQPSCLGLFDVVAERKEDKDLIKIIVASGSEKPYYRKKKGMSPEGCYIRLGTASEPMEQRMIDDLYSKRTRNSIGKIKSNQQDLTFEQLKIYYEAKGTTLNKNFAKTLELQNEEKDFNYVAYLMADENGTSVKVAKYKGTNRVDLIESNEYGYESIVKATKSVLDKIDLENATITQITAKERIETRLWNPIALREAIINAFVHNDYTRELAPKFEIYKDRIEITSAGGLPQGLSQEEFFEGFSVPRNKELMRIFKDLDLVEQLGSGIPRILEYYDRTCFKFSENFLRMTFPKKVGSNQVGNQVGNQVSNQGGVFPYQALVDHVLKNYADEGYKPTERSILKHIEEAKQLTEKEYQIIKFCQTPRKRKEILENCLGISNQTKNHRANIEPLLESDLLQLTIKDKPNSQLQKYRITNKAKVILYLYENKLDQ